jgi:hypothetical protein
MRQRKNLHAPTHSAMPKTNSSTSSSSVVMSPLNEADRGGREMIIGRVNCKRCISELNPSVQGLPMFWLLGTTGYWMAPRHRDIVPSMGLHRLTCSKRRLPAQAEAIRSGYEWLSIELPRWGLTVR